MKVYQGFFLVSNQDANKDLDGLIKQITESIQKSKGEIISANKWDERRLAFEIKRQKRGTYILVYFKMAPTRLVELEHDLRLTEFLLRHLITLEGEAVEPRHTNPYLPCKSTEKPKAIGEDIEIPGARVGSR